MKKQKIYMQMWLKAHRRVKIVDTDQWYLDFANSLLPDIAGSAWGASESYEVQKRMALAFALYLEDCVADGGNWRQFIHWHKENHGRYLPFYALTEDYLPDEINREDVAFLLWGIDDPAGDDYCGSVENPMDRDLLELAGVIYERLDAAFESAPVSENLAADWVMETGQMEKKRSPLPVAVAGNKLPEDVERFLESSTGEPLLFFDSYELLRHFLIHTLKWGNEDDSLFPELTDCDGFVLYANPKGILIGMNIAFCFAAGNNPFYDAEKARKKAYSLFCERGVCPFDLLKYAMENNLLPEAQFLFEGGKALLHENWDFIACWFLGEYYEGK